MRKARDDSTWNRLTPEQRETLEGWLFDENLGYARTLELVQKEFGIEATIASLGRFYRRRAHGRQVVEMLEAQVAATELNDLPVKADDLRKAAVKLLAKATLKLGVENPEQLEQLASLTKLLLESESNDIRRSRVRLAEQYFHYEATAAYEKDLPHFKAHVDVIASDDSLSYDEKLKRVKACFDRLVDDFESSGIEPGKSKNED